MSLALGLAVQLAINAPLLIVYVIGLIMLQSRRDRLSPATVRYGIAGLLALLVHGLLGLVSLMVALTLPEAADATRHGAITTIVNIIEILLSCLGVGLLIAAIIASTARSTPPTAGPPPSAGPPAPGPHPWPPQSTQR